MKCYETKKLYLPLKSISYIRNNRFCSKVAVFWETSVFGLFWGFIRVATLLNLIVFFLIGKGKEKSSKSSLFYASRGTGKGIGYKVQCFPLEQSKIDGIFDGIGSLQTSTIRHDIQ